MSFLCPYCNPRNEQPARFQPPAGFCYAPRCRGTVCGTCGKCQMCGRLQPDAELAVTL
jgi:hypothetical protein